MKVGQKETDRQKKIKSGNKWLIRGEESESESGEKEKVTAEKISNVGKCG